MMAWRTRKVRTFPPYWINRNKSPKRTMAVGRRLLMVIESGAIPEAENQALGAGRP